MSLFDKFKNITEFTERESYLAIVYGVIASDGEIQDSEVDSLLTAAGRTRLFCECTEDQFVKLINNVNLANEKNGLEWLFQEANRVLSPDLKKAAFATAVDLAFADGSVG